MKANDPHYVRASVLRVHCYFLFFKFVSFCENAHVLRMRKSGRLPTPTEQAASAPRSAAALLLRMRGTGQR